MTRDLSPAEEADIIEEHEARLARIAEAYPKAAAEARWPDTVRILTEALTGPTSLSRAEYLAPGTAWNLIDAGYMIVKVNR